MYIFVLNTFHWLHSHMMQLAGDHLVNLQPNLSDTFLILEQILISHFKIHVWDVMYRNFKLIVQTFLYVLLRRQIVGQNNAFTA